MSISIASWLWRFSPSLLPGIALGTLWSKARRSTIVLSPLPYEWDHHYYIHWQIWRTKEQVISSKTTDSIVIVCKNKEESYSPRCRLPTPRTNSQQTFKISFNDLFWTIEPLVTKLGMLIPQKMWLLLPRSKAQWGLFNQNMTVSGIIIILIIIIYCVCFCIRHLAWSLNGSHCWLKTVTSICTCITPHIHSSVSVLRMTKTPIPALLCSVALNPFVTRSGSSFCLANLGQAYSTPCWSLAFRSWGSDTTFHWGARVEGVDAKSGKYESSVMELHVLGEPHRFVPPNRPQCHSDSQAFPSKMQTYRQVLIFTLKITVPMSAILWTWFL